MNKRHAIYCRVSTADQHSGLESQIRALKEYCEQNHISEYEVFSDENISGAKVSRPSLDRLMTAARKGEISSITVYSFSRFARSTTHLLSALEEFQKLGIGFTSITERIEQTHRWAADFTGIAAIAQLERELIVERVKNGLKNARAKGKHIGRKKTRPSELIRALRASGLPLREVARVAVTSHGSVSLELKEWAKEARQQGRTLHEAMEAYRRSGSIKKKNDSANAKSLVEQVPGLNGIELSISDSGQAVELEFTR